MHDWSSPRDVFDDFDYELLKDFAGVVMDLMNSRRKALRAVADLDAMKKSVDRIIQAQFSGLDL